MNISSAYMVILHACASFIFKVFEHEIVWIQIRSYLLYCQFTGPDLGPNRMQYLPVDETIVDTCDFAGPDLDLNCI